MMKHCQVISLTVNVFLFSTHCIFDRMSLGEGCSLLSAKCYNNHINHHHHYNNNHNYNHNYHHYN